MTIAELFKKWANKADSVISNIRDQTKPSVGLHVITETSSIVSLVLYSASEAAVSSTTVSFRPGKLAEPVAYLKEVDEAYAKVTSYDELLDVILSSEQVDLKFSRPLMELVVVLEKGKLNLFTISYKPNIYEVEELDETLAPVSPEEVDRKLTEMFA